MLVATELQGWRRWQGSNNRYQVRVEARGSMAAKTRQGELEAACMGLEVMQSGVTQ